MSNRIKKLLSSILFIVFFLVLQKVGFLKQVELLDQHKQVKTQNADLNSQTEDSDSIQKGETENEVLKNSEYYTLVRAVDGDTLVVLDPENQEKKVRLIGVNTPETVDPRRTVECFGKEASNFTKELVVETTSGSSSRKNVRLEFDDTQQKYDKYGRLLAYAYLVQDDGAELFLNRELIKQGYAYEYTYKLPYKFQSEFKKLEQEAKSAEKGLWGGACTKE